MLSDMCSTNHNKNRSSPLQPGVFSKQLTSCAGNHVLETCLLCLVMHMLKCIHGICVFQVQLSFVPTNVIASIREVWEPPVQIQEANVQYPFLNKRTGTYRQEYYMTIHRHT